MQAIHCRLPLCRRGFPWERCRIDISPKGDPLGFVAGLDEKTLAVPDRSGNHCLDTFENLLSHPEVGLFFMIPGNGDTLRVSGKGRIVRDNAL
jgi:predicted pyridoxine 5'-phosphate oxidase superfamily flavin-nucleotide-binding protein